MTRFISCYVLIINPVEKSGRSFCSDNLNQGVSKDGEDHKAGY
jgi:hypothetical protein